MRISDWSSDVCSSDLLVQVENREALEDRVFLHDVVIDQRYRLRTVQVEIGIAKATNVESRKRAAKRGFDVQARYPRRQHPDILATRTDDVELLATQCRDRHWHVLDVLGTPLRGNRHQIGRTSWRERGCQDG